MLDFNTNADPGLELRYEQLADATDKMCERLTIAKARVEGAIAVLGDARYESAAYLRLVNRLDYTRQALTRIGNARHAAHDLRMAAREPGHRCASCELERTTAWSETLGRFVTIPENDNR